MCLEDTDVTLIHNSFIKTCFLDSVHLSTWMWLEQVYEIRSYLIKSQRDVGKMCDVESLYTSSWICDIKLRRESYSTKYSLLH